MGDESCYEGSVAGAGAEERFEDMRNVRRFAETLENNAGGIAAWMDEVDEEKDDTTVSGSSGMEAAVLAGAIAELRELGTLVQRKNRAKLLSQYWRGRPVKASAYRTEKTYMRQFSVAGSTMVTEFDTAGGLYDSLAAGRRVVTQLLARTGLGKTVKLPSGIVRNARKSVLVLEPDVRLARYAADVARTQVDVRRAWKAGMTPCVVSMSYADFCANFFGNNGVDMLQAFDVILFDEAHYNIPEIEVAKILVATYGPATLSVILCSATLDGEDMQSGGKPIVPVKADITLDEFVTGGYLWKGEFSRDRTLVITKSDRQALEMERLILSNGFMVRMLDSASRFSDVEAARDFMRATDSITNRFLVVTSEYGLGYNHICDFVVTAGENELSYIDESSSSVVTTTVSTGEAVLKQHLGRAGREGNANVSAVICTTSSSTGTVVTSMNYSQRVKAYFLLRAAGVIPVRGMYDDVERELLPYSVTRAVAQDVLAVNMLPEISIRFFAKDGKVPLKYAHALEAFCTQDHIFHVSDYDEPVGFERWTEEVAGSYYDTNVVDGLRLKVPLCSTGDTKVVLHSVAAVAVGLMEIENWRCATSDVEAEDVVKSHRRTTSIGGVYRPRAIEEPVVVYTRPAIMPYAYNVPVDEQRNMQSLISPELSEALANFAQRDLACGSNDFTVQCDVDEVIEKGVSRIGILSRVTDGLGIKSNDSPTVDALSPNGSVVVSFRKSVWDKMVEGQALKGNDAKSFFYAVKNNVDGFVDSDAFSGWTAVWFSMFATFGDPDNVKMIRKLNLVERATNLLLCLVARYTTAVRAVSKASYVRATLLKAMLAGGSIESAIQKSRSKGRLEIIQSRAFYERLYALRDGLVEVVTMFEANGVFSPTMVIQLQTLLPIMRKSGNDTIDAPRSRFVKMLMGG